MIALITGFYGCSLPSWTGLPGSSPQEKREGNAALNGQKGESAKASLGVFGLRGDESTGYLLPRLDRVRPQEVLVEYERLEGRHGRDLEKAIVRARPHFESFSRILNRELVPTDLLIIPFVESHFRSEAVSSKGATGLWQFTRATGRHYGLRVNLLRDERKDPERSTEAAGRYLFELYRQFGDWPLALAAYNCGAARVRRACKGELVCDYWKLIRRKALPPQTRKYVPRLLASLLYLEDRDLWPFRE